MASAQMQVTFETVCSTFDEIFKYEGSTVPEGNSDRVLLIDSYR